MGDFESRKRKKKKKFKEKRKKNEKRTKGREGKKKEERARENDRKRLSSVRVTLVGGYRERYMRIEGRKLGRGRTFDWSRIFRSIAAVGMGMQMGDETSVRKAAGLYKP